MTVKPTVIINCLHYCTDLKAKMVGTEGVFASKMQYKKTLEGCKVINRTAIKIMIKGKHIV